MYPYDDPGSYFYDSYESRHLLDESDRLTHLVLVDGRLVDAWSERVEGTPWQRFADRFDEERRPVIRAPEPPPRPSHERALAWLACVCGGADAVAALDGADLVEEGLELPHVDHAAARHRLESTADLLDAVAERLFDAETGFAFRRALLRLWSEDPDTVLGLASAVQLAGGIVWAVGKANGLLGAPTGIRIASVQDALGLKGGLSNYGQRVRAALIGYRDIGWDRAYVADAPSLEPLGCPDLLLGTVRRRLARMRDRALEAQAASAA